MFISEKELINKNVECIAVQTDVSIESDCKNLIDKAVERFSKIDVLINNAGLSMRANFRDVDLGVLKKLMDVNFWGTVYCTKYALPYLLKEKGSVTGVSSIAGFIGLPGRTGYSASKFAMHGFLETLRIENLKKGVHVMLVAPGLTAVTVTLAVMVGLSERQVRPPDMALPLNSAQSSSSGATRVASASLV